MAPKRSEWICKFLVEDHQRHPKGFTIYKLTSVVFPIDAPEASTKLVIWKRYNDFKRLHFKIKTACHNLNLPSPPNVARGRFFDRFNERVIADRVTSAQALLDFIVEHKSLFLGEPFRNFCDKSYTLHDSLMGQGPVSSVENGDNSTSKWNNGTRSRSEASQDSSSFISESSDEDSFAGSDTNDSGGSVQSMPQRQLSNNNNTSTVVENSNILVTSQELKFQWNCLEEAGGGQKRVHSIDVEDPAGSEPKPFPGPPPEQDAEVICHSELPQLRKDAWLSVPPAEERLSAYRVVGIMEPVLLVTHRICPSRRLVLKVLRKSSWPLSSARSVGAPRPVPHMVQLYDYVETEDAIFLVLECAVRGLLWDHVRRLQDKRPTLSNQTVLIPSIDTAPPADSDVDMLVAHAQRLLESVSRTMEQSEQATSSLHHELEKMESALGGKSSGHKPRSASAAPRPRLERRFSCDDGQSHRPRTAHGSLDRGMAWCRLSEPTVRGWASALVAALDTLHARGIIWRDLHPGNLLVGEGGSLLLSFQHRWPDVVPMLNPVVLRGLYVAPEVRSSVFPITTSADWWSAGALLYELLTGMALSVVHPCGVGSHTTLELPEFLSIEAKSLLTELLQFEPAERLGGGLNGAEDVRCHPFFNEVDWDKVYQLEKYA